MTQTVMLGDIAEINMGQSPKSEFYNTSGEGLPFMQGVRTFGRMYPLIDTWCTKPTKTADKGDVLFSVRAPVGDLNFAPEYMCIGRGLASLKSRNNRFLYYLLEANKDRLISSQTGSVFGSVNATILKKFRLTIPESIEEQDRIADILGTIDKKIELNRKMNETLEQMGQALFRHYFIDNPEAEKWERKKIGELCDVKIGRTPPRKEPEWFDKNSGEAWVSIKDMGQGATFISDSSEYLTREAVAKFNVPAIEPNTLLLSFKLTVGRLCISTKRMYSNEAIAQLPIKSLEVNIEYLYYFLRNFDYSRLSSTSSIATAVNSTTVKNIEVVVPSEAVMKDFTAQAHDILEVVKNNEAEIQTLTTLCDILLPRLINGKVKI